MNKEQASMADDFEKNIRSKLWISLCLGIFGCFVAKYTHTVSIYFLAVVFLAITFFLALYYISDIIFAILKYRKQPGGLRVIGLSFVNFVFICVPSLYAVSAIGCLLILLLSVMLICALLDMWHIHQFIKIYPNKTSLSSQSRIIYIVVLLSLNMGTMINYILWGTSASTQLMISVIEVFTFMVTVPTALVLSIIELCSRPWKKGPQAESLFRCSLWLIIATVIFPLGMLLMAVLGQ